MPIAKIVKLEKFWPLMKSSMPSREMLFTCWEMYSTLTPGIGMIEPTR